MRNTKKFIYSLMFLLPCLMLFGCNKWQNPGDSLGGGGVASEVPTTTDDSSVSEIEDVTDEIETTSSVSSTSVPTGAVQITSSNLTISSSGNYYVSGTLDVGIEQIKISAENVVLFLNGATINKTTSKKVINAKKSTTIVLVDGTTNLIKTTYDDTDAIGSDADLIVMGGGTLNVVSTDDAISVAGTVSILGGTINCVSTGGHGINAESIIVENANITTTTVDKDGLHAEIDYDDLTVAPTFTYEKGYVYLKNATLLVTTTGTGDGIQADSFVQIVSGTYTITTNSGAPTTITETSSDNAEGKAIKAGVIDWGASDSELSSSSYAIYLQGGTFTINSNDDAIHSNGSIVISGGQYTISAGDDGIHADSILKISGGTITINKCYEGIESAKIEISGGTIALTSSDDGINASDGTTTQMNQSNSNCYIIISGGKISVNASGDGLDSNGTVLISGGETYVNGPTSGADGSLDSNGGIIVNGGILVAVGSLGMVETPTTTSSQYVVSFATKTPISSGTRISLTSSDGSEMYAELTTLKASQSVIISCPNLQLNSTYKIYGGSTVLSTFTVSSKITQIGSTSSSSNPGGFPGMR